MSISFRLFSLTKQVTRLPSSLSPQINRNHKLQAVAYFSSTRNITTNMAPVPSQMKAVVVEKTGGSEVLQFKQNFPVPQLNNDEVLVKNDFAGINYIDTYFRTGLYPGQMPLILGQEGAGSVVATKGNTLGLKVGDRVVWMKQGAYAQYTAIPAARVVKIPDALSEEDVLGSFLMGMTAIGLVREAYAVLKGDKILVHAAAGGVGLLLCQILKDIGATVYGTASTKEKCDLAKANGADHMVNYKDNPDWVGEMQKLVPEGFECVYDSVGKTTWEGSLEVSKRKGTVIYFGNASGPVPPFNIQLLAKKNTKIMRSTLMQYIVTREEMEWYSAELFKYLSGNKLKVHIHKTYELQDVKQAHEDLESRGTTGKLLIRIP